MRTSRHLASALALLVLATAARAGGGPSTTSAYLRLMDANGDGRVSLAEYQHFLSRGFHRLDRNGDDILERDELRPGQRRHGAVTLTAYLARVARVFRRQDSNHDGYLDARELAAPPR